MSFLETIDSTGYEVITSLVAANVIAQVLKTIIYAIRFKKLDPRMLVTTGGMPSSHSSSIVAMACSVGLIEGFSSLYFALAFAVSAVVLYDSAGVRRAAGRQATVLNKIIQELFSEEHKLSGAKLKELLGHSPKEVLVGSFLGILVSMGIRWLVVNSLYA